MEGARAGGRSNNSPADGDTRFDQRKGGGSPRTLGFLDPSEEEATQESKAIHFSVRIGKLCVTKNDARGLNTRAAVLKGLYGRISKKYSAVRSDGGQAWDAHNLRGQEERETHT